MTEIIQKETLKNMTLINIAKVCGGTLFQAVNPEAEITCAVLDSRKIEQGGLFLAVKGEKVDGHRFISQVFSNGALCVITEKTPEQAASENIDSKDWGAYILVDDTLEALKKIAAYYRSLLSIPVIGIVGSVGKTSTKEFVAGVLGEKYKVQKTQGNFNNEIGLPLTLLSIRKEHEVAVVEMGISDFGEMSRLGTMARPDICVMTNIGQCHLEKLHDRAGIFKAKTEIFDYMAEDSEICINGEDDMLSLLNLVNGKPVHRFGVSEDQEFEVFATDCENLGLLGSRALMHIREDGVEKVYPIEIPLPGQHMIINAMAGALVGKLLHLSAKQIQDGISNVKALGGRSHIMKLNDRIVIDDCYNANPVSMKAALELLATAEGRKVAVMGDMFELGADSDKMHAGIGGYAVEKGIDVILCTGEQSRFMYEAAVEKRGSEKNIYYYKNREELLSNLPGLLKSEDTVLVKASHGMEFPRVVELLQTV